MKLSALLITLAMLQVSARSVAQKITLNEQRATLDQVFKDIRKQSGYDFFYDGSLVQQVGPITIIIKDATVEETLKAILKAPLSFTITDKTVTIEEKSTSFLDNLKNKLKAELAQVTITGKVTDETGAPLPGVTVKIKGTTTGTQTDSKGQYSLTVPDDKTIISFSFIGYETQEFTAKDITTGSVIKMKATETNLKEVVVNKGYYTERKELSTGSVGRVTAADIEKQPVSDPIMALEGRVAGLSISQASGMPGAAYNIQLRGRNSIQSGNNPLYIVDGVPFTSNSISNPFVKFNAVGTPIAPPNPLATSSGPLGLSPFNSLNPSDIESIEILKDADATAIYGSRGANGVVLITTKKGKAGQTAVDVNIYSGVGQVTRTLPLLNTQQYLAMRHEAFKNDGATPDPSYDYDITGAWDTTRYTDWQKVLIGGTAHFTNAQMSLSGGTANTQFRIGGGYSKQTTVFPGDYADEKASTHVNINHSSTDQKFKILFSAQYVYDYNVLPRTDFTGLIILAPDAPALYNSDGSVNFQNGTFSNPMVVALQKATATSNNLISNLNLSYQILPGLQLRSSFGYTHYEMNQSDQRPATAFYGPPIAARRENAFGNSAVNTWIIEPQISYNRKLGSGKLDVLIGSTVQRNQTNATGFDATNFLNDASIPNVAAAASLTTVGNDYSEYRYNALYARLNYNLEDKYIINLTGRRDGSSRFGPGKQFGNFGAIGGAWVFSKEKFIENELSFLSFGKLRASYGTTGNDQITNYQYLSAYANQGGLPYQGVTGLTPNRIANPYFAWEVNKKLEAALELGFLKDRINIEASYYRNRTGNQLVGYPLPAIDGFNTIQFNLPAVVQNTGLELTLNTVNVISKNFRWNSSFNISMPRNKLVSYPNIANSAYAGTYEVGQSLFIKNLYHSLGVDPQTGIYQFRDVNNDGQFSNPADLQFEKQLAQNYFGGFQNTFSYKQWSVDIFFQFVKQTGLSYLGSFDAPGMFNVNQPDYVLSRWQKPGDNTNVALFSTNYAQDPNFLLGQSNAIISDASFIRLKNLSISYSFPDKWKRGLSLKNARIYLQAQNLFTITSYKGLDPETQGLLLPPLRMITTGIQLSL